VNLFLENESNLKMLQNITDLIKVFSDVKIEMFNLMKELIIPIISKHKDFFKLLIESYSNKNSDIFHFLINYIPPDTPDINESDHISFVLIMYYFFFWANSFALCCLI